MSVAKYALIPNGLQLWRSLGCHKSFTPFLEARRSSEKQPDRPEKEKEGSLTVGRATEFQCIHCSSSNYERGVKMQSGRRVGIVLQDVHSLGASERASDPITLSETLASASSSLLSSSIVNWTRPASQPAAVGLMVYELLATARRGN